MLNYDHTRDDHLYIKSDITLDLKVSDVRHGDYMIKVRLKVDSGMIFRGDDDDDDYYGLEGGYQPWLLNFSIVEEVTGKEVRRLMYEGQDGNRKSIFHYIGSSGHYFRLNHYIKYINREVNKLEGGTFDGYSDK